MKGGISITAFGVMAARDAAPGHATIQGDIKNGFNEVQRETMLQEAKKSGKLNDTVAFMHALLEPSAYVGMGKGTELMTAPFRVAEGTHQGAVESGWLFSLAVNPTFKMCDRMVAEHGVCSMSNISVVHQKMAKFNMFVESSSSKTHSKMTISLLPQLRYLYATFCCLSREQDFYVGTSTWVVLCVFLCLSQHFRGWRCWCTAPGL